MKILSDIRLFQSEVPNVDGAPWPSNFGDRYVLAAVKRLVMKLRESGFSLGNFDHLYLNFTTCSVSRGQAPAARSIDRYHPWYRFYDVEVNAAWLAVGSCVDVLLAIERVLCDRFATEMFTCARIHSCIEQVMAEGEQMRVVFKEKETARYRATLYLRYLDSGVFSPQLTVRAYDGQVLLLQDLPYMTELSCLGEICFRLGQVVIKPRKHAMEQGTEMLCYDIPQQSKKARDC